MAVGESGIWQAMKQMDIGKEPSGLRQMDVRGAFAVVVGHIGAWAAERIRAQAGHASLPTTVP